MGVRELPQKSKQVLNIFFLKLSPGVFKGNLSTYNSRVK